MLEILPNHAKLIIPFSSYFGMERGYNLEQISKEMMIDDSEAWTRSSVVQTETATLHANAW